MKNVISFPQDIAAFAKRLALLSEYHVGDRVNSVRGPGRDLERPPISAGDASVWNAHGERFAQDENGYLVFPAIVKEVRADGKLLLAYEDKDCTSLGADAFGLEEKDWVTPRVTMPWHPTFLKGQTKILLRRNMRGGTKLEGLEVRWRHVSNILHALTKLGRWRLDGEVGPMHRYYDKRLFHLPTEAEILHQYAPEKELEEVNTAEGLARVGFDVADLEGDAEDGEAEADFDDATSREKHRAVDAGAFDDWLTFGGFDLGDVVQKWWAVLPPADAGEEVGLRRSWGR